MRSGDPENFDPSSYRSSGFEINLKTVASVVALAIAIATPVMVVGGYKTRIESVERKAEAAETSAFSQNTRIATVEESQRQVINRLDRIENKLDLALYKGNDRDRKSGA